ncbi:hypothetical protein IWW57_005228, partial [Coemansia sp. S610]
ISELKPYSDSESENGSSLSEPGNATSSALATYSIAAPTGVTGPAPASPTLNGEAAPDATALGTHGPYSSAVCTRKHAATVRPYGGRTKASVPRHIRKRVRRVRNRRVPRRAGAAKIKFIAV